MIYSMTAFARRELKAEWGTAVWEIRSVNQRFLETYFRLPEQFKSMEPVLRERFRKSLQRGKVECALRFVANDAAVGQLSINEDLAKQLMHAADWVQNQGTTTGVNPVDILRWPGVIAAEEADMDSIQGDILKEFDLTLKDFIAARATEGENLKALIEQRLDGIQVEVDKVTGFMPEIIQWQRDKIQARFEEAKIELDATRVEQEMVMLAQKVDVAEELDRLVSHIGETRKILKKGGAVGRRLDFMMQEFNRESNTLGSKSINTDTTQSAVELKVLIEQMREQIANIE
ncbi:YicC/YloC family endoribonuclease [Paraglaciecola aquimarina]|uniref:YicC/YloC family endoribonuclease n=1 Tax=Paraglaciecola aquimarina TaxID=1235557 RepID=A0ABU3STI9_9ALTE|nr:YicC/YloC family endoribonuclease [Paraglaciecola aquimarina]MDU0353323.1 YicC/YloC family endoribonuclease [Paraglaciecola aquimarina]